MLHFKNSFYIHGTKMFQKESHGWNELPIYLSWRSSNGNTTHIHIQWREWNRLTLLMTYSTASKRRWWYEQCYNKTNSTTTGTNDIVRQLYPTISTHSANFVNLRWWYWRNVHPNNWQSHSAGTLHSESLPSHSSYMVATNTHPRYAENSDSRKSWAIWQISTIRSARKPNNISVTSSNRLYSHRGTTRHAIACPHRDQLPCHRLLSLRQAIRTSDWRGSRRLPPWNIRAS